MTIVINYLYIYVYTYMRILYTCTYMVEKRHVMGNGYIYNDINIIIYYYL